MYVPAGVVFLIVPQRSVHIFFIEDELMVDDVIFEKALTTEKFIKDIEALVSKNKLDYLDAVVHYCETNNVEIEAAAMIIRNNVRIKSKLQTECEELNFLPKRAHLPL
jgi:hypothetical protein